MTNEEKALQYFTIAIPENEEQSKAYFQARKALITVISSATDGSSMTFEQLQSIPQGKIKTRTLRKISDRANEIACCTASTKMINTTQKDKMESCERCKWQGRHQKCSCCRRNRYLKDCYEET